MNCQGEEILRHLTSVAAFNALYSIELISTYLSLDGFPELIPKFNTCDVLITNNIKNYPGVNYTDLVTYVKPDCKLIKLGFLRFNGFWPDLNAIDFGNIWNTPQIIQPYEQFINQSVESLDVLAHFEAECEKFKLIDAESDVSGYDWFIENYRTHSTFSDYSHPTSTFMTVYSRQILDKLGIDGTLLATTFLNNGIGDKRFRAITNPVASVLGLVFDLDSFYYLDHVLNRKQYHDFVNHTKLHHAPEQHFHIIKPQLVNFLALESSLVDTV